MNSCLNSIADDFGDMLIMDSEKVLFEKGCFLPSWIEETEPEQPVSKVYHKDLTTLLAELNDIKRHIEDVRERGWILAQQIQFHNNNFVRE